MNNSYKIKKLLKKANEEDLQVWKEIAEEAKNIDELPKGIIKESTFADARKSLGEFIAKGTEAKDSIENMSSEERAELKEQIKDPDFIQNVQAATSNPESGAKEASRIIDSILIKQASKYFTKAESIEIVREINIFQNLHQVKIASKYDFHSVLLQKEAAFNAIFFDKNLLNKSSFLKLSSKYSTGLIKEADGSWWDAAKGVASGVAKGVGYVGGAIKSVFKFAWKALPFVGFLYSAYTAYQAVKNMNRVTESIQLHFSKYVKDFEKDKKALTDGKYIGKLISAYQTYPKSLLEITKLNKVAKFYKKNWFSLCTEAVSMALDILELIGLAVAGAATVATSGGALPLFLLVNNLVAIGVDASVQWFDVGLGDYNDNAARISTIAETNIKRIDPDDSSNPFKIYSDEEVKKSRKQFEKLKAKLQGQSG